MRLALLATLLVACERETKMVADTSPAAAPPAAAVVVGGSATTTPICAATGQWSPCQLMYRLERSGLVPLRDTAAATEGGLSAPGILIRLGPTELEAYFYMDASARQRDAKRLNRSEYVEYPAPVPMRPLPTLITSVNLIAILHSRNDHLRERVSDAITAGPPQPAIRP